MSLRLSFVAWLLVLTSAIVVEAGTPKLQRVIPPCVQHGKLVEVHLQGRYLDQPQEVMLYEPGITVESIDVLTEFENGGRMTKADPGTRVRVRLNVSDACTLGPHGLRLRTADGISEYQRFFVGPFATIEEDESNQRRNDKREAAKSVSLNSTVIGRMGDPTDLDLYSVEAKKGQRLSIEIDAARLGVEQGIPDLHLALLDTNGKVLIEADDSALLLQDPIVALIVPQDGTYFVEVRHSVYAASNDVYLLHVGTFSRPTAIYPAGGQAGQELSVRVLGDPLGERSQKVTLPTTHASLSRGATSFEAAFVAIDPESQAPAPTPNSLRVSPFANVLEAEPNDSIEVATMQAAAQLPIAYNGVISKPGDIDCFHFAAKKGDRFRVHALANALGSELDPTIWIKQVGAKAAPQRATDSRINQLGLPNAGGMNRDTLDPILEFTVPADGEYVLGVEDDRGNGRSDFVYRVECSTETDAIFTYIPPEPENQFSPQARQTIGVPAGGRYNTTFSVVNTTRPFNGELELVAIGLPEGIVMHAPHITPSMPRVPVVFEAAPGAKLAGGFVDVVVRPVASDAANDSEQRTIVSGFRQNLAMNASGNNDYYLHVPFDRLAVAVIEPASFSIEVEEPKSALVQNGEMALKFKVIRAEGFDGAVNVSMEWKPNGVTTATPVSIPAGKNEGEYLIGAARNATAGSYQVTLTGLNGGERPGYRDGSNRTYVATKPFSLNVAEPHIDA